MKRIRTAVLASLILLPLAAAAETLPAPAPGVQATPLLRQPLAGDANRDVLLASVVFAPGASTGRHRHHGEEYATVLEGELELLSDNAEPRRVRAGDAYLNARGVVHETRNTGSVPARVSSTFIIDRNKPLIDPVR